MQRQVFGETQVPCRADVQLTLPKHNGVTHVVPIQFVAQAQAPLTTFPPFAQTSGADSALIVTVPVAETA